ncbi:hypothetical protein PF005_g22824 [Phytophthora fragariae]|uniref:Uncharacterized protein n=1 Tax=Phytophthora fragariae TaxID=53985 RepID=A0A6A3WEY9_9STRA|nr:hypothetical protein PF011_g28168 [Phytophthora fragariae]KAE9080926.1 hypothetical protein PF010_g22203 [Phytophthora fragariae]KAE9181590.1 hypothetical protein PF005_g22824 [Phytophthora fragariae]KAE9285247.1 hypothetical protein PF001_g21995 [Phytophthora fragariae]
MVGALLVMAGHDWVLVACHTFFSWLQLVVSTSGVIAG